MALMTSIPYALAPAAAASATLSSVSVGARVALARRRGARVVVAMADILGDFGARDPFPEEIESNFAENTLGDVDTLHRILIPTLSVLSLARLPLDPAPALLSDADARMLLHKVVGWRLVPLPPGEGQQLLQCTWKVRDDACGHELVARINAALQIDGAEVQGSKVVFEPAPKLQVTAELHTPSAGGLTVNDFIVAARIDQVKATDLIPKKRAWA